MYLIKIDTDDRQTDRRNLVVDLPEAKFVCKLAVVTVLVGVVDIFGSCSVGVLVRGVVDNKSSLRVCRTSCMEDSRMGVASPLCSIAEETLTSGVEVVAEILTELVLVEVVDLNVEVGLMDDDIVDDLEVEDETSTSTVEGDVEVCVLTVVDVDIDVDGSDALTPTDVLYKSVFPVDDGTTDVCLFIFEVLFSLFFSKSMISTSDASVPLVFTSS